MHYLTPLDSAQNRPCLIDYGSPAAKDCLLILRNTAPHRGSGYTLPELLVTLGISTLLLSLALPAFSSLTRRVQAETTLLAIANAWQLARNAAISYREPVVMCPINADSACGTDWTRGALVFSDPNHNRRLDDDERLLTTVPAPPEGSQLVMKAALGKQYLRVMSNGMLENTAGSLIYCPANGSPREARNLIFTRNGRMRFGDDRNRDGIPENAEGQPLSCPL